MSLIICNLARYGEFPEEVDAELKSAIEAHQLVKPILWCTGPQEILRQVNEGDFELGGLVWIGEKVSSEKEHCIRWAFLANVGYTLEPPIIKLYGNKEISLNEFFGIERRPFQLQGLINSALDHTASLSDQLRRLQALKDYLLNTFDDSQHRRAVLQIVDPFITYAELQWNVLSSFNTQDKRQIIDMSDSDNLATLSNVFTQLRMALSLRSGILAKCDTAALVRACKEADSVSIRRTKGIRIRLLWWSYYFCHVSALWRKTGNTQLAFLSGFRALETWSLRVLFEEREIHVNDDGRFSWKTGGRISGGGQLIMSALESRVFRRVVEKVDLAVEVAMLRQFIAYRNRSNVGHGFVTPSLDDHNAFFKSVRRVIKQFEKYQDLEDMWWSSLEQKLIESEKVEIGKQVETEWRALFLKLA